MPGLCLRAQVFRVDLSRSFFFGLRYQWVYSGTPLGSLSASCGPCSRPLGPYHLLRPPVVSTLPRCHSVGPRLFSALLRGCSAFCLGPLSGRHPSTPCGAAWPSAGIFTASPSDLALFCWTFSGPLALACLAGGPWPCLPCRRGWAARQPCAPSLRYAGPDLIPSQGIIGLLVSASAVCLPSLSALPAHQALGGSHGPFCPASGG